MTAMACLTFQESPRRQPVLQLQTVAVLPQERISGRVYSFVFGAFWGVEMPCNSSDWFGCSNTFCIWKMLKYCNHMPEKCGTPSSCIMMGTCVDVPARHNQMHATSCRSLLATPSIEPLPQRKRQFNKLISLKCKLERKRLILAKHFWPLIVQSL